MPTYTCTTCGAAFALPVAVVDRYPGWTPTQCSDCRDRSHPALGSASRRSGPRRASATGRRLLTTDEVLAEFSAGPENGIFTDGGAVPNPGPGGWGAVYVVAGAVVDEAWGHEADTTNNRMELIALLQGVEMVPDGTEARVLTDSRLAVNTITEWAAGWERRGWRRKRGPVENLDLVRPLFAAFRRRPELQLEWIAAHSGFRWNEYADALAGRWRLDPGTE